MELKVVYGRKQRRKIKTPEMNLCTGLRIYNVTVQIVAQEQDGYQHILKWTKKCLRE